MKKPRPAAPIHPGKILKADMDELGISINQLGRDLRVPVNRLSLIVNGRRGITADTALRLARYFDTSALYWMNLQSLYDVEAIGAEKREEIERGQVIVSLVTIQKLLQLLIEQSPYPCNRIRHCRYNSPARLSQRNPCRLPQHLAPLT